MINRIRYWWHEYRGTHLWPWDKEADPDFTDVNTKCRCGIALQDYVGKHR